MTRLPQRSTHTDTLSPYTPLCRSQDAVYHARGAQALLAALLRGDAHLSVHGEGQQAALAGAGTKELGLARIAVGAVVERQDAGRQGGVPRVADTHGGDGVNLVDVRLIARKPFGDDGGVTEGNGQQVNGRDNTGTRESQTPRLHKP